MKRTPLLSIFLLLNVGFAQAADLRGNLTGIAGARVSVSCGSFQRSVSISKNGGFHITDLPVNQSCHFTVNSGKAVSVRIAFNTNQNVTDYRGILRKVGNKVIVIRK